MKSKFKKLMALAVSVMMCLALTGCIHTIERISIDKNGSGTISQHFFYSVSYIDEEAANAAADSEETINGKTYEEIMKLPVENINGKDYYMDDVITLEFTSPDEFNQKIVSGDGLRLIMVLTDNEDGSLSLDIGDSEAEDTETDDTESNEIDLSIDGEITMEDTISAEIEVTFDNALKVEQTRGRAEAANVSIANNTVKLTLEDTTKSEVYSFRAYFTGNISTPAEDKTAFSDVDENAWYYEAVSAMAKKGIVNGYGDGKFGPSDKVTVAQVCQILSNLYDGKDIDGTTISTGADNGYWAYKAIESMKKIGSLPGGFNDKDINSSNYDVAASREIAIAAAAYTYCQGLADESAAPASIPDALAISSDCTKWINEAYRIGITHGVDANGTFNPGASLTRAELCQMIYNII